MREKAPTDLIGGAELVELHSIVLLLGMWQTLLVV